MQYGNMTRCYTHICRTTGGRSRISSDSPNYNNQKWCIVLTFKGIINRVAETTFATHAPREPVGTITVGVNWLQIFITVFVTAINIPLSVSLNEYQYYC